MYDHIEQLYIYHDALNCKTITTDQTRVHKYRLKIQTGTSEVTLLNANFTAIISGRIIHSSDKPIRNVQSRVYILTVHVHKYQLYWYEQHKYLFNI